ncbi:MAG: T9SS type A sorting domain-containing protein [Candidatus Marinimicrobia bacterium]|nr:T9SS type A sorting domain-containing protein [Candidatus Neomarinimicrobiota bacterium]
MKKLLLFVIMFLITVSPSLAITYNTPTVDGAIAVSPSDWDADEEFEIIHEPYPGASVNDYIYWYFTFDASSLFFGFRTAGAISPAVGTLPNDKWGVMIFIDTDPTSPIGSKLGSTTYLHMGLPYAIAFHADYCFFIGGPGSGSPVPLWSTYTGSEPGGSWSSPTPVALPASAPIFIDQLEWIIPRSLVGNPAAIKISAVIFDDASTMPPVARASWPELSYSSIGLYLNTFHAFLDWRGYVLQPGVDIDRSFGRNPSDQSLPIELASFKAVSSDNTVLLEWITESEVNNLGFDLYRSESAEGNFTKINEKMIDGAVNSSTPTRYSYVDQNVVSGNTYYYKLVDISGDLQTEEHGPYSVFVDETSIRIAEQFELMPAYPNPFNPSTKIQFSVPELSKITINIFDINGKLVKTLTDQSYENGNYILEWNGTDSNNNFVSAGVYFTVMKSNTGFTKTNKMLFVK